ncbi:hypothetical protein BGZ54_005310, partial [Gamsiella multidivaricata]
GMPVGSGTGSPLRRTWMSSIPMFFNPGIGMTWIRQSLFFSMTTPRFIPQKPSRSSFPRPRSKPYSGLPTQQTLIRSSMYGRILNASSDITQRLQRTWKSYGRECRTY